MGDNRARRRESGARWALAHPDRVRTKAKKYKSKPLTREANFKAKLKFRFGITVAEYQEMLVEQDSRCAICRKLPDDDRMLSLDHCHSTGKLRALLCPKCNSGLGMFDDSVELFQTAIDYVQKYRTLHGDSLCMI